MQLRSIITGVFLTSSLIYFPLKAQEYQQPLDIPILLSGNFGELRNNHFHSGIDFKTQGGEGKPIHAVQKGYVSRISVSPWGYGNGLYLTHPDGTTTVYGHLQTFSKKIADYVKEQQYKQESFNVNLMLTPDMLPVEKGEIVALSGNSGSSGGPHLHFEVRDTKSEEILDPIECFKNKIIDTRAPKLQGIMIYPVPGKGCINGSGKKQELKLITSKNGKMTVAAKPEVWGEVGFAVKAYDNMDNTGNVYGVKEITLSVDDEEVFHSYIDRYAFDETRYLNSFIDYDLWKTKRSFFMKSFIDPGNRLPFLKGVNRGIITIDENRTYTITYKLADIFGNTTRFSFAVEGKKQPIPEFNTEGTTHFHWGSENKFGAKGIRLTIPRGNLYEDLSFRYDVTEDESALSATHILHDKEVPIHKRAQLSLYLQNDTLQYKHQYGIVRLQKGNTAWIGGTYRNGWIDADIKEFGTYAIGQDTKAPTITPINQTTWINKRNITFRLSDNMSGVQTYKGTIDGQFVLFEMNNKSVISYHVDPEHLQPGKHILEVTATDGCGNESLYRYTYNR